MKPSAHNRRGSVAAHPRLLLTLASALTAGLVAATAVAADAPIAAFDPPSGADYAPVIADAEGEPVIEPPAAEEIAEAESSHADLGANQALSLATEEFDEVISAQPFPEIELEDGAEVGAYLGPYTARIEYPGAGPDGLVESSLPLRAPEDGAEEPIDADLVREGDHFEADNPIANTDIPVDLSAGIELKPAGVHVTPVGAEASTPIPVEDKVFVPNTDTDTDALISPTPVGFEIAYVLRSESSPEVQVLELGLPAGAELESAPDGAARVVRGGEELVAIGAPRAWDAADQPVDVHYEIDGDRLRIVVPHRGRDYLRPLIVDPPFGYYEWSNGQTERRFWSPRTVGPFSSFQSFDVANNRAGLTNRGTSGNYYNVGQVGQWNVEPIRASYIERVDFFNFDQTSPASDPSACTVLGLWAGFWVPLSVWNDQTNGYSQAWWVDVCGNLTHQTRRVWAGAYDYPRSDDLTAPDGTIGTFGLVAYQAGWRTTMTENLLRSANVYRFDRNVPQFTSVPGSDSVWRDDDAVPNYVSIHDDGLGVYALQVVENLNQPGQTQHGLVYTGCDGSHLSVCPVDYSFEDYLPQGRRQISFVGWDAGGQAVVHTVTARVDRTDPKITSISGSLLAAAGQPLTQSSYKLNVSATDGSTAPPASERSGVASTEILVDGVRAYYQTQACPSGSCPMTIPEWTFNTATYGAGRHMITVTVTDHTGHKDHGSWVVGKSDAGAIDTRFELAQPTPLAQVQSALQSTGLNVLAYEHHDATTGWTGGYIPPVTETIPQEATTYRAEYSQLVGAQSVTRTKLREMAEAPPAPNAGDPPVSALTLSGSVPTAQLGALAPSVASRIELDRDAASPDPLAEPKAKNHIFAPGNGAIQAFGLSSGRVELVQALRFSANNIHQFGPNRAFELDVKEYNPEEALGRKPFCDPGDLDSFYINRQYWEGTRNEVPPRGRVWQTNLNGVPYFDVDITDPCNQEDLTVGVFHPDRLIPGVDYFIEMRFARGDRARSKFTVEAQMMINDCSAGVHNPVCIGTLPWQTKAETYIEKSHRLFLPGCYEWHKAAPTERC